MRILVALIFSVCISAAAFAGPKEDVQATISAQLEAFLKDDFETAFTFASPSIRSMFQTPQNFGLMVQRGYPMVWRPQKFSFLEHRKDQAGRAQDIQIFDQNGTAHYLRYFLINTARGWKISGVQFLNPADFSV